MDFSIAFVIGRLLVLQSLEVLLGDCKLERVHTFQLPAQNLIDLAEFGALGVLKASWEALEIGDGL